MSRIVYLGHITCDIISNVQGDRFTGKTSIYINTIINQNRNNYIKSVEGFGCKRVLGV